VGKASEAGACCHRTVELAGLCILYGPALPTLGDSSSGWHHLGGQLAVLALEPLS
jgi:hypothetical protein